MEYLKRSVYYVIVVITMFSFVVSTTGFLSYTHNCQHHESESSLVIDDNGCCSVEEKADTNKYESCCQTIICEIDQEQTSCCTEEVNYYRLSEWFTSADSQKKQYLFYKVSFLPNVDSFNPLKTVFLLSGYLKDFRPTIKTPIYILLSQKKLDPHLS